MSLRAAGRRFWQWYQDNYLAVLVITTGIFLLQLFHLYWLFTDVVLQRLTGTSYYAFTRAGALVSVAVDYLEIPTLVSASLLYVHELRTRFSWRAAFFLLMLNTQWVHILWITDEVVVESLARQSVLQWSAAVAWVAILIDFLELPVIADQVVRVWRQRRDILAHLRQLWNAGGGAEPHPAPLRPRTPSKALD